MMLLPGPKDACPICAVKHDDSEPHNKDSLYYQMRFMSVRGRWPTWADAMAHCTKPIRDIWERELRRHGMWSEPLDDLPIADPPAESIHQCVGEPESRTFGLERAE